MGAACNWNHGPTSGLPCHHLACATLTLTFEKFGFQDTILPTLQLRLTSYNYNSTKRIPNEMLLSENYNEKTVLKL